MTVSGLPCCSSKNAASWAGGRGVARFRFTQDVRCAQLRQLSGDRLLQKFVGDDPDILRGGKRLQPVQRLLDHRAFAIQREHLLGAGAAAARPEARAAAPCKNDRRKRDRVGGCCSSQKHLLCGGASKAGCSTMLSQPAKDDSLVRLAAWRRTPSCVARPCPRHPPRLHTRAGYVPSCRRPRPARRPRVRRSVAAPQHPPRR